PIVVRDLSLGGALLECEGFEFERDQVIWVRVRLGHIFCNLKCHICRLIETNRQVRYGCEFEDVSEGQTDALCSYVFQRQRERINKKRNDY
ncbi:MAG: PilZ domain-containing protein, partial [Oscillospiraceae bacterium]